MLTCKKILCPTDLSEPSFVALDAAVTMARQFNAALTIVHVITPVPVAPDWAVIGSFDVRAYEQELRSKMESTLRQVAAQHVPPEIPTHTLVTVGEAAHEIVNVAEREQSDLVVIATHGRTGWRHLVFGSVTEKVARHVPCPVLIVHCPMKHAASSAPAAR
jgi:nucleotide-binding universal stress UspA family protein